MDSKLAAIIIHDIKNSLGLLEGQLHVLTDNPSRELASAAHESCVLMRERLIGFLTLYKAASSGLSTHIEPVDVQAFLSATLRRASSLRGDLCFTCTGDAIPAVGFFDEHLVELALDAALQNAARFARSRVVLGCRQQDDALVLVVADDGPGLGTVEAQPSTGVGMALCAAIAQAHRRGGLTGSISLENRAEGGAVFTLRLP